ncbi:hypothetical protein [Vibrio vulnificus]|uniref:hypothetical protein n=1 Tax=Vibrio vulnificus TaxID=672 RepID=UPI003ED8616E
MTMPVVKMKFKQPYDKEIAETTSSVLFITILITLISLQSFYFPYIGSGLTYLGYLIPAALCIIYRKSLSKSDVYFSVILSVTFLSVVVLSFSGVFSLSDFKSILAAFVMVLLYPLVKSYFYFNYDNVVKALRLVITIHSFTVLVQILYWLFTREYLDFMEIIMGSESRSLSRKGIMLFGERLFRFSGLFNEPGTYSVILFCLSVVYYKMVGRIDVYIAFSIFSILSTMSAYGIVLSLSFLFYSSFFDGESSNVSKKLKSIFVASLCILPFVVLGGMDGFIERFSSDSDYSGGDFRKNMIYDYFSEYNFIFGYKIHDMPDFFVPNDIGVWFSILTSFGIFGFISIFIVYSYVIKSDPKFSTFLILSLIMVTKIKFTYPLMWLLIALLLISRQRALSD